MANFKEILEYLRAREAEMVRMLGELVRIESSTFDKAGVDRVGRKLATEWRQRGARVEFLRQRERGNHLRAELWLGQGKPAGQILVLGHMDTVYERGTLENAPFRITGGRAYGPGTLDMKGGLVNALFAVDALRAAQAAPRSRFVFLWTADEEIGSETSRPFIEKEALGSQAVLVLEPASGATGKLKTERKAIGGFELTVTGRAAHAGINPQDGVNAVHEMALQIARIVKFNDARRGVTVNADVISGGARSNVIAASARAAIDARTTRLADMVRLVKKMRALRPILEGAKIEVRGGLDRPPMESRISAGLFKKARALAKELGFAVEGSLTGGGSDGNLTAALGVATLDGLGAVGAGAHTPGEYVTTKFLPQRAALLAALLASV
jgi:glutamate carboxypeptidase